jgi:hypothetical protein
MRALVVLYSKCTGHTSTSAETVGLFRRRKFERRRRNDEGKKPAVQVKDWGHWATEVDYCFQALSSFLWICMDSMRSQRTSLRRKACRETGEQPSISFFKTSKASLKGLWGKCKLHNVYQFVYCSSIQYAAHASTTAEINTSRWIEK